MADRELHLLDFALGIGEALGRLRIMKRIAQSNDALRIVMIEHTTQMHQRRNRVIGRQQHAAAGKAGAFFQMQIGHDDAARCAMPQCT
jgi:hypothetical protein